MNIEINSASCAQSTNTTQPSKSSSNFYAAVLSTS